MALALHEDVRRSYVGLREPEAAARHIRDQRSQRLVPDVSAAMALEFAPRLIAGLTSEHPGRAVAVNVSDSSRRPKLP